MKKVSRNKVFITGASGFIGSHVAEYFCSKGIDVVCGIRKTSNIEFLKSLPVTLEIIDYNDPVSIKAVLKNTEFVIHTAGLVNDWSSFQEFYKTNVSLTMNLLQACRENQIKDLIITGTNASYGEENHKGVKSEDTTNNPRYAYFLDKYIPNRLNYYRITKTIATRKACWFAKKYNMNMVVLEPVWVYGEREFSSGFYEYMKVIKNKPPFFPGSKKNHFHVIYAKDLARAFFQAYTSKLQGVNRIIIGNKKAELMERVYATICKELNVKKPFNLPKPAVYPVGLFIELLAELLKTKNPPILSRSRVNMFYDNIEYSTNKAFKMLSFQQGYSLEEGIKNTVNWYKENQLI